MLQRQFEDMYANSGDLTCYRAASNRLMRHSNFADSTRTAIGPLSFGSPVRLLVRDYTAPQQPTYRHPPSTGYPEPPLPRPLIFPGHGRSYVCRRTSGLALYQPGVRKCPEMSAQEKMLAHLSLSPPSFPARKPLQLRARPTAQYSANSQCTASLQLHAFSIRLLARAATSQPSL
jgi:hypothetical protein